MSTMRAMSSIKASAAPAAKSSWVDVVKKHGQPPSDTESASGKACDVDTPAQPMQASHPGKRGSRTCLCRGLISVMLGPFGWIEPLDEIDHPLSGKNEGQIYLSKRDIADNKMLEAGQAVTFYLYADEWGLGAEVCCAADGNRAFAGKSIASPTSSHPEPVLKPAPVGLIPHSMKANAPEFVPNSVSHWPSSGPIKETPAASMNVNAQVFVPSTYTDLQLATALAPCEESCKVDMRAIIAEYFCDDSDDETGSTCSDVEAGWSPSSVEESGDSDPENQKILTAYGWVRPPPGLSLPGMPAA